MVIFDNLCSAYQGSESINVFQFGHSDSYTVLLDNKKILKWAGQTSRNKKNSGFKHTILYFCHK